MRRKITTSLFSPRRQNLVYVIAWQVVSAEIAAE